MYHWQRIDFGIIKSRMASLPVLLRPQPNSGSAWIDVLYVLILVAVQCSILPSTTGGYIGFDLLSGWLAVSFIRQSLSRGLVLAAVASLALETHTVLPAGTYFCAYGCALVGITNVKEILSWNVRTPWFVTSASVVAWVWLFELGASLFVHAQVQLDILGILYFLTKLTSGLFFGMILASVEFRRSHL